MSRWNPYKQPFIIFSLIMVAVILRLFLMNYWETIEVDGVAYASIARDWIEGKGLDISFIPPVYPLAIGFLFHLVGNYELSGRLISVVSGGLLILPVFLLSQKLYNKQTAYYAATLTLLYPILAKYSTTVLTESIYTLLLITMLYMVLLALEANRIFYWIGGGVLVGIGSLVRPELLGYLPYIFGIYFAMFLKKRVKLSILCKNLSALLLASMIFAVPYMFSIRGVSGKVNVFTFKRVVGERNFYRAADEIFQKEGFHAKDTKIIDPLQMARASIINLQLLHKFVIPELFPPLIIVMIGIGLFRMQFSNFVNRWDEIFILLSCIPYITYLW